MADQMFDGFDHTQYKEEVEERWGKDAYAKNVDPVVLRTRVGMVFQKPNPFPKSIYDNVAYGPRIHGMARAKKDMDGIVEQSLRRAGYN